jgi:hypothetical protein
MELNSRVPQRPEPTDQENRGGQTERGSEQREEQRREGIHAAREYVLAPYAETKEAYAAQRQNDEPLPPDRFARKRGNQMRREPETRKDGDINFGLRKKPEEPLPEQRGNACRDFRRLILEGTRERKKLRTREEIRK